MIGLITAALLALPAAAAADGTPDITLAKEAPERVLYGESSTVRLTAANQAGQPTGYNLSFRDVLPDGISYVPGSAPASVGEPQIISDAPATGQTTLIWSNVSDLTANSDFSFTYDVEHDPGTLEVGDTYQNDAGAYINCDPRFVPDFDANGVPTQSGGNPNCSGAPEEESYTGFATASATTEITAIELEKTEPSPEEELLRGLHDHQTVYTLRVENNSIDPTDSLDLEDYLPAGIEFLGCGQDDNTTDASTNPGSTDEYPGSGPIDQGGAPPAGCVAPDLVETVQDPLSLTGIYTHVVWNDLADLAPGQVFELRYVAAIPIRANTLNWSGAEPTPASGLQASNLDNNSGPETFEDGGAEPSFENSAIATGTYQDGSPAGVDVDDGDTETVIAEDLRVLKSRDTGSLIPGTITHWTLDIATSEYRFVDDLVVTDTLGDGYCPLDATDNLATTPPGGEAECDPEPGEAPTSDYTTTTENVNGSWTLVWDSSSVAQLDRIEPSSTFQITFPTRTRSEYQQNFADDEPILTRDIAGNGVHVAGNDWIICAPGDPSPTPPETCGGGQAKIDADEADGTVDEDVSSAEQEAPGVSIDKRVDSSPNTADCLTGTYVDGPAPQTAPGDTLCYRLRLDFPAVDSGDVSVTDFIPPGTTYVAGSAQTTTNNNVSIATTSPPEPEVDGPRLTWPLDDGGDIVGASQVFEMVIQIEVERAPEAGDGDILENLQKAVFENTSEESFPLRDAAPFELVQPELSLLKGVAQVNGGATNPPNTDGVTVSPGDDVTYRLDVTNGGSLEASSSEVWDELPAGVTCDDVDLGSIDPAGICNPAEHRIEWNGVAVPANSSVTLNYTVEIPEGFAPTQSLVNHAGVREYESPSGTGPYTHIPSDNIDPTQEPSANAGPADDPSNVVIANVLVSKERSTEINETGNNAASQATIGEEIDYTIRTTIPAGTTLYGGATFTDNIGTRQTLVGTPSATIDTDGPGGSPATSLPANGVSFSVVGTTLEVAFPDPYANSVGSGEDIVEVQFTTKVDDDFPANFASGTAAQRTLPNSARLDWETSDGTARNRSASTSTTIVEPNVSLAKSNDAAGPLNPGDDVTYTVTASNASGASTAHDAQIVDHVPAGLTPVNAGTPVADGGAVDPDGGIWDETAHTITWDLPDLPPAPTAGSTVAVTYDAEVDPGAVGAGTLTNTADLTVTSLPDGADDDGGERTSASAGSPPGYADDAQSAVTLVSGGIVKASAPDERTIGDVVTTTITVTLPPQIENFDATVVDELPDGLVFDQYVTAECTAGCAPGPTDITPASLTPSDLGSGRTRIGWFFGDLEAAPDARTVELVYRSHVADQYDDASDVLAGESLENVATFAFNLTNQLAGPPSSPPDPATFDENRTDEETTTVIEPLLVIDKDVSGDPDGDDARDAEPGDDFTYTLNVMNSGDAPAHDVVVTDQPDPELTDVVATDGPGYTVVDGWTPADPDLRWRIAGPVAASGGTVSITYTGDLVPSAELLDGDVLTNTADIEEYFGVPEDERDTNGFDYRRYTDVDGDTVDVTVHVPDLVIDKTTGAGGFPDSAPAEIESPFGWRIVATNPNAGSRLLGVDVTDTLPENWSYVAGSAQISGTGTLTPGGQVEPDESGGELRWENVADLLGGQTVILEFQAVPDPTAAIEPGLAAPQLNDADAVGEDTSGVQASEAGPYADDDDAAAVLATPVADLAITKTAGDPTPVAGTPVSWAMHVTNEGPDSSPAAIVRDVLPAGLAYVSATSSQGSCDVSAGVLACNLGTLASGASADIELVTRVDAGAAGVPITNLASVDDPVADDPDPTDDADDDPIVPTARADLRVAKRLEGELVIGRTATYAIDVANHGPSDAKSVTVVDELPATLTPEGVDDPSCSIDGQRVECALGTMAPGAERTIRITARLVGFDSAGVTNAASATSPTLDPDVTNNEAGTTDPIRAADLAIEKDGPDTVRDDRMGAYLLTVRNASDAPSGGTARVVDTVPTALDLVGAAGEGWQCATAERTVTCERSDSLEPGAEYPPIRVRTRLRDDAKADEVTNVASVALPGDTNPANDEDDHTAKADAGGAAPAGGGVSCTKAKLSAVPAKVFVDYRSKLKIYLEARSGPVKHVRIKLRHQPSGKIKGDRTNRRGIAEFEVRAESTRERWTAVAKRCEEKMRIEAVEQPWCRDDAPAGDPGREAGEGAVDPRRRC